jgi:hypothetical protein
MDRHDLCVAPERARARATAIPVSTDRANQAATVPDHEAAATAGGEGPLARLLETRGGTAAPEAPFRHRAPRSPDLHAVPGGRTRARDHVPVSVRWQRQILSVAAGEMLHLALVHNLLSAIGMAPHLSRPNLPVPAGHYPAGVQLALLPFDAPALRHFMFLERPEGMDLQDAEGLAAPARRSRKSWSRARARRGTGATPTSASSSRSWTSTSRCGRTTRDSSRPGR